MAETITKLSDTAQFQKIKSHERLFLRIVEEVSGRIMAGDLKPGDMLPPERIMCEQFGVSRTVVREAIKALELQGVVEVQHGRGVMVAQPSPESVVESMVRFVTIQESPLWDLVELRSILEVEIAGLAALRAQGEDIARLREVLSRMAALVDRPTEYVEQDMEFHRCLWRAAHNQLFPLVLEPFITLMRESRRLGSTAPNAPRRSLEVHTRLLEAVQKHDKARAQEIMREHFDQVAQFLTEATARAADSTREGPANGSAEA